MPSSSARVEEKCQNNVASTSKYKVARSERLGRFMVAARNVAAGEVILRETPVLVGPTAFCTDYLCFACLRSLPKVNNDTKRTCTKCGVAPLCGTVCQEKLGHHTPDECELFARNRDVLANHVTQIIVLLLPLRVWLLKKKNPSLWDRVDCMEDHMEKRKDTPVWKDRQINVVEMILTLGLVPDGETYDAEFLHRLCGILDVNSFELRSPDNLDGLLLRGLYTEASLMAHDCRGNTHLTVDNDFQLTVYASQPINEGEFILFNYTSSLLGTAERREHLREGKYFECDCSLCSDPFEMDTHLSTILCPRCKQGCVGILDPLVVNPYNKNAVWQCEACRKTYGGGLMKATLDITRKHINDSDGMDIKELELLASKLSRTFHPNHSLMLALKQKLLAAYRKEVASMNPSRKIIQRMLELCKEVFQVLDIVQPGISRLKGIMLYEMHLPMVLLANRLYSAREISTSELAARLEEAGSLLKKALTMLLLEPATTPEGRLAKRALQEMKVLNSNIADVKALPNENNQKPRGRKTKEGRKKKN